MRVYVRRMMECRISIDVECRTWYIGVIRRSKNFLSVDSFLLSGHSLYSRVWDFFLNGVPVTCVVPPDSVQVVATVEYNLLESGEVHVHYGEFGDEGWPRGFGSENEFREFLSRKLRDLELTVFQKILSGEVV